MCFDAVGLYPIPLAKRGSNSVWGVCVSSADDNPSPAYGLQMQRASALRLSERRSYAQPVEVFPSKYCTILKH